MIPRLADAVEPVREVVRIRHAAHHVGDIRQSRPILPVGGGVARIGTFAEDIYGHVGSHGVNLVASVSDESLDGLYLRFPVDVMVVHQALDLSHTVRESHVVEIDFVKAELLDCLSGQFHVKLPNLSVISAWPVGFVMLVRLSGGDFGDGALRIVLHEIGVLKTGDSSHYVEPLLV